MRSHRELTRRRWPVALAALALVSLLASAAAAGSGDDVERARAHYKRGVELYDAGEYNAAIAEFAAADQLAASPLNEFNIALCYERLGDAQEAVRRYRSYLASLPSASNRASVEAKIQRLEAELREKAAAERAAAERAAAEKAAAEKAAADKAAADKAAADKAAADKAAADKAAADKAAADAQPFDEGAVAAPVAPAEAAPGPPAADSGSMAPTGDPQLDRVAAVDVASIRNQYFPDQAGAAGGPGAPAAAPTGVGPGGAAAAQGAGPTGAPPPPGAPADEGKSESKPFYKQWWFWVVAGVSGLILLDIATSDSGSSNLQLDGPSGSRAAPTAPGGTVIFTF